MKSLHRRSLLWFIATVLFLIHPIAGHAGSDIELHQPVVDLDLDMDLGRGSVTLPLHTGTLATTGATVYFVISDALSLIHI